MGDEDSSSVVLVGSSSSVFSVGKVSIVVKLGVFSSYKTLLLLLNLKPPKSKLIVFYESFYWSDVPLSVLLVPALVWVVVVEGY